MPTIEEIIVSIDRRLGELKREIDSLSAARGALDGADSAVAAQPPPPARRRVRRSAARRKQRTKATRPAEVVPAGKIELLLSDGGEMTTTTLAERANGDRDQVLTLLRELEAVGRVRRVGQRRGTRWHAITDEDRIRERAAELEALRRSSR